MGADHDRLAFARYVRGLNNAPADVPGPGLTGVAYPPARAVVS